MSENSHPVRRALLVILALGFVLFAGVGGWLLTRPISPGTFVIRIVPSGSSPSGFNLSLFGPGSGKLAEWKFQGEPGPNVLAGLDKKIPWTAVATNASQGRPCLRLESAPFVPPEVLLPVERLVLAQCCPGLRDTARCPIQRVTLGR